MKLFQILLVLMMVWLLALAVVVSCDDDDDDDDDDTTSDDDESEDDSTDDDMVDDDDDTMSFTDCVQAMDWYLENCSDDDMFNIDGDDYDAAGFCALFDDDCLMGCVNQWGCDAGATASNDCWSSECGTDG